MKELRKERHVKTIEELTFTDDGMFQTVLHEPDVCAELVERLLHIKVGKIEYPELEKRKATSSLSASMTRSKMKTKNRTDFHAIYSKASAFKKAK